MQRSKKRALVRGARADFWHYEDDNLVLFHHNGYEETSVPSAHLVDDALMEGHYARLSCKSWVPRGAILELKEIAAGARQ